MSSSNKPITPPMYATNDWIISRARALIDYDSYDEIEKWLDNSGDEDDTFEFPEYFEDLVGEIQDYDPDNRVLTPMTLVERLEAAAAKTEKYDNDEEQESDLEDINSHLSLAFSSGDELLPSTLVSHHRDRVVGKTGVAYASLDEMLYEHVPSMKIEPGFTTARVQTVSIPARTPSDNYALESIALPPPAYIATDRHRRKKYVRPRLYSYSDMDNMEKGLGIERGLSPIPRIRGNSFSRSPSPLSNFTSASASTLTPISSHIHPIPDSVPSESSREVSPSNDANDANATQSVAPGSLTQPTPRLCISKSSNEERYLPEILQLVSQSAGQFLVPGPSPTHFITSPFADDQRHGAPDVIVEEGGLKYKNEE